MVDNILASKLQDLGTLTRLKVTKNGDEASLSPALNKNETAFADSINLSQAAREMIQKNRKLDGYLQIFKSALQILNGSSARIQAPTIYKAEVEYFKPKTNSTFSTKI